MQIAAQILVCLDGILAVHDLGVVTALVEHADVNTHHRGIVHTTAHSTLIGRNDHQIVLIHGKIGITANQRLNELVGGAHIVKAAKGHGILHTGIVCIKGDDVLHTHSLQLLQHQCTVKRLASGALVLTPLIQHGHDHRYAARLACNGSDHTLEIGKMIVRAHGYLLTVHFVGHTVIEGIAVNVNVVTAQGFVQQGLCLTGAKARALNRCDKGSVTAMASPFLEIVVNLKHKLLRARHTDNTKISVKRILHSLLLCKLSMGFLVGFPHILCYYNITFAI